MGFRRSCFLARRSLPSPFLVLLWSRFGSFVMSPLPWENRAVCPIFRYYLPRVEIKLNECCGPPTRHCSVNIPSSCHNSERTSEVPSTGVETSTGSVLLSLPQMAGYPSIPRKNDRRHSLREETKMGTTQLAISSRHPLYQLSGSPRSTLA
jgi:hypothetical protein